MAAKNTTAASKKTAGKKTAGKKTAEAKTIVRETTPKKIERNIEKLGERLVNVVAALKAQKRLNKNNGGEVPECQLAIDALNVEKASLERRIAAKQVMLESDT